MAGTKSKKSNITDSDLASNVATAGKAVGINADVTVNRETWLTAGMRFLIAQMALLQAMGNSDILKSIIARYDTMPTIVPGVGGRTVNASGEKAKCTGLLFGATRAELTLPLATPNATAALAYLAHRVLHVFTDEMQHSENYGKAHEKLFDGKLTSWTPNAEFAAAIKLVIAQTDALVGFQWPHEAAGLPKLKKGELQLVAGPEDVQAAGFMSEPVIKNGLGTLAIECPIKGCTMPVLRGGSKLLNDLPRLPACVNHPETRMEFAANEKNQAKLREIRAAAENGKPAEQEAQAS